MLVTRVSLSMRHLIVALCLVFSTTNTQTADISYQPFAQALDVYAQGQYSDAIAQLARFPDYHGLTNGFRKEAPKWIAAGTSGTKERRAHVVSIVALEIARLGFIGERLGPLQFDDAMNVMEVGCGIVRNDDSNQFNHLWLLASVALIQGAQNYFLASSDEHLFFGDHWRHAVSKFPEEGRFRLAAILTSPEARRMPNRPGTSAFSMTNGDTMAVRESTNGPLVRKAIERYGTIVNDPGVGAEARLRRGILLFHRADFPAALADIEIAITSSSDPYITHVGFVYKGLTLDALERPVDAIVAYESALRVVPRARSAALVLAEDLFSTGRREEAAELLQATFGSPALHDPWLELSAGDYRFWTNDLQQLRETIRP